MSKSLATLKSPSRGFAKRKKTLLLITMVLPGAIWLFLLRYVPLFGILIAFKDYKIFSKAPNLWNNIIHSEWVGFDNFKFLFTSTDSLKMIKNTLGYNALWIALGLVISVSFAIMLSQLTKKFIAKTYQTLMFFPYFLSWIVASYFLLAFLDKTRGMIPNLQQDLGMQVTDWYNTPGPWPIILTLANLWKYVGYSSILYLAAITGIDSSQYEAASIDGASKWQQIRYITLPNLKPMIIILFIMNVSKIFNSDFGLFFTLPMNSGPLIPVTQTIDTYVYRVLMTNAGNPGMSTAASLFQNLVGFLCLMGANSIVRKVDEDSSLF
ncbi:MAG: binding-protein-dependent transport system inner rane component [Herbinix sp.]|jgi:putative aldouronate transport system permease protein|nr:binding-protein-dependent transport system inner rane component [Herbinix sp.]